MSITVLMYHHVLPKSGFIASSLSEFESQMKFLSQNGYKTLSSDEFLKFKKGELKLPKKSVFITFDDGWRDNYYYAYPILKRYGLNATLFLVTSWIEKASEQNALRKAEFRALSHKEAKQKAISEPASLFLNWDEVEKMKDVFDFHSHTNGHDDAYFGNLRFEDDIFACKKIIKDRLGFDDAHLCWPRGQYDENKLQAAKQIGYKIFYTTKRGINKPDNNLKYIKRVAVKKDAKWLKKTLFIYQNDILGSFYSALKN